MEQTTTPEGLVRRSLVKEDGRRLNFYNPPGEDQPINSDAESSQPLNDPATATLAMHSGEDAHV